MSRGLVESTVEIKTGPHRHGLFFFTSWATLGSTSQMKSLLESLVHNLQRGPVGNGGAVPCGPRKA